MTLVIIFLNELTIFFLIINLLIVCEYMPVSSCGGQRLISLISHVFLNFYSSSTLRQSFFLERFLKLADRLSWLTSKSKNAALCLPHLWDYEGFPPHLAFSIGPEIHRKDLMLSRQVLFRLSHFPSFAYAHLILSNAILFVFWNLSPRKGILKKKSFCV